MMEKNSLEQKNVTSEKEDQFETDAQRIVRRHLENKNDVITDEDLRSVRIGQTIPVENVSESKVLEELNTSDDDTPTHPPEQHVTPWDAVK